MCQREGCPWDGSEAGMSHGSSPIKGGDGLGAPLLRPRPGVQGAARTTGLPRRWLAGWFPSVGECRAWGEVEKEYRGEREGLKDWEERSGI